MNDCKKYIRGKYNLQDVVFSIADMAEVDVIDIPNFMREVADDIEKEINRQKDK